MKKKAQLRGAAALLACAAGLVVVPLASAGSPSAPEAGSYKGPAESFGYEGHVEIGPSYAKVSHSAGGTSISLELYGQLDCGTDEGHPIELTVTAKTVGAAFSHAGTTDERDGNPLRYQLKGKFTKPTSFKGTLKASGEFEVFGTSEKAKCTADINFTEYRSKA